MDVKHIELGTRGAFVVKRDGKRLAEMTYLENRDDSISIDHTQVDESLRGQGMGEKLLTAATEYARENGLKVHATCPYALKKLSGNSEYADVFID